MLMRQGLGCILGVAILFATGGSLRAELLYAVDSSVDSLYTIDSQTGAATLIGPLGPGLSRFTTPVAMAIRPSDGAIFVVNNSPDSDAGLAIVAPATGSATRIGGGTNDFGGLAFDSAGTLYTQFRDEDGGRLATIDPATGAVTSLQSPSLPRLFGLDFNPADGLLYGLTITLRTPAVLLRINPGTGGIVSRTQLEPRLSFPAVPGSLVFLKDGKLVGSNLLGRLFDIDPATGKVSNFRSVTPGFAPQGLGRILAPQ
jgi:hypothetical protein